MFRLNASSREPALSRVLLALCCIALVIFGGVVEVAHGHSNNDISRATCSFCATAHVVTSPAAPIAAPARVKRVTAILVDLPLVGVRHCLVFSLRTRPPPVDPAVS